VNATTVAATTKISESVIAPASAGPAAAVLLRDPLQHRGLSDPLTGETAIRSTAAQGISGSASSLPYLGKIQHSFGRHNVSGIRSHTGGASVAANRAMGSEGYATGNSVAFRSSSPSLHTVAHEAAHVVQQRAGVALKGGVGQAGDVYERHADAVAEAVVQGKSAEGLLDRFGPARSGGGGVQRKVVQLKPLWAQVKAGTNTVKLENKGGRNSLYESDTTRYANRGDMLFADDTEQFTSRRPDIQGWRADIRSGMHLEWKDPKFHWFKVKHPKEYEGFYARSEKLDFERFEGPDGIDYIASSFANDDPSMPFMDLGQKLGQGISESTGLTSDDSGGIKMANAFGLTESDHQDENGKNLNWLRTNGTDPSEHAQAVSHATSAAGLLGDVANAFSGRRDWNEGKKKEGAAKIVLGATNGAKNILTIIGSAAATAVLSLAIGAVHVARGAMKVWQSLQRRSRAGKLAKDGRNVDQDDINELQRRMSKKALRAFLLAVGGLATILVPVVPVLGAVAAGIAILLAGMKIYGGVKKLLGIKKGTKKKKLRDNLVKDLMDQSSDNKGMNDILETLSSGTAAAEDERQRGESAFTTARHKLNVVKTGDKPNEVVQRGDGSRLKLGFFEGARVYAQVAKTGEARSPIKNMTGPSTTRRSDYWAYVHDKPSKRKPAAHAALKDEVERKLSTW